MVDALHLASLISVVIIFSAFCLLYMRSLMSVSDCRLTQVVRLNSLISALSEKLA